MKRYIYYQLLNNMPGNISNSYNKDSTFKVPYKVYIVLLGNSYSDPKVGSW